MYNILWMDDDFIGPVYTNDGNKNDGNNIVNSRRECFLDDVKQAEKFDLKADPAKDIKEFQLKFSSNPNKYQAVILDIMDLNPNDSTDASALPEALKLVEKTNVLTYVYSNNPDMPGHKDYIKVHLPADHVFSKAEDVCDKFYRKIISDLNDANSCFNGHEYCLNLLNKGYLSTWGQMRNILSNKDSDTYLPFNDMRQVLENMLDILVQRGIITSQTVGRDSYVTFNNRMNYITKLCPPIVNANGNNIRDWNNPYVPYSDCRHEIKWVLDFLGNITNRYSHYLNAYPSFLLSGDLLLEYSKSIRGITYEAFFVSMKWYYGYMVNKFG